MIELTGERLSATINPFGAELTSLRDAEGRELMSDGDPAFWTGRAPLLFPIVGRLNGDVYRYEGKEYALPQHGFARRQAFTVFDSGPGLVVLRLTANDETRAVYPFSFTLDAEFAIQDATLTIGVTVINRGPHAMPVSFGFHPAFAWPLPYGAPREAHKILFETEQPQPIRAVAGGLIAPELRSTRVEGRRLALDDALFAADALIWDRTSNRSLRYGPPEGPALEISYDAPQLGIWTKPGARFLCVEPWWGHADPEGFDGDIWQKPGIRRFDPGEVQTFTMKVTLSD